MEREQFEGFTHSDVDVSPETWCELWDQLELIPPDQPLLLDGLLVKVIAADWENQNGLIYVWRTDTGEQTLPFAKIRLTNLHPDAVFVSTGRRSNEFGGPESVFPDLVLTHHDPDGSEFLLPERSAQALVTQLRQRVGGSTSVR